MLSSFEGFMMLLGIEKIQRYLIDRKSYEIEDWSTITLDDEGKALQLELNVKFLASSSRLENQWERLLTITSNYP